MKLFAQLRKVDEEKRLVFGRIAEEAVDHSGEIMDYAKSKPYFEAWSQEMAKATDGKNLGNVRAMHGKVAAGGLTGIDFNDSDKAVDVCAKIVDDGEWKKVLEGIYTGFSIGGSYVGSPVVEKMDGKDVKRYVAKPSEVSLVDRPCMPGAKFFEVQKADGTLAKVDFAHPEGVEPEQIDVVGTDEEVIAFGKALNEKGLTMGDMVALLTKGHMPAALAEAGKGKGGKKVDGSDPDADNDDDTTVEGDKDKDAVGAAAAEKAELAEFTKALDTLAVVEKALSDALAQFGEFYKVGARNSKVDAARITKIHDMTVELGAACGAAVDKAAPTGDLQKMIADAIAPLQKAFDEQAVELKKLKDQPAPPRVALRAITKGDEMSPDLKKTAPEPIVDASGEKHEAASLIKNLHAAGGVPLHLPETLRK